MPQSSRIKHSGENSGGPGIAGRLRSSWFIIALLTVLIIHQMSPNWHPKDLLDSVVEISALGNLLVAVLFFIQGLGMDVSVLIRSLKRSDFHLRSQLTIFFIFPLLCGIPAALILTSLESLAPGLAALGLPSAVLLLSVLPTTVSSSTVYTRLEGGASELALINAVLANILGILLSPLLVSLLLQLGSAGFSPTEAAGMVLSLLINAGVPLIGGTLLRLIMSYGKSPRRKLPGGAISQLIILLIVLLSPMKSTGGMSLGVSFILAALLYASIARITLTAGRRLPEDEQTALFFLGTQKTMAMGLPLLHQLKAMGAAVDGGITLLIVYHALQLIVGRLGIPGLSPVKSSGDQK
ncbi:bile acid:sodium symporter [Salinispira pacifica]|uniref:Sodium/bile acid symporter family n=1 Tax=Salinispira pacifica TaxID=1307761 RepID=V5WHQ3_9SPIO|nr:bile acid:sodium symporter [Salinispira pacifica]AHC14701.1 hypothetical protein L21SP2_1300 [Salinispira pacifica]